MYSILFLYSVPLVVAFIQKAMFEKKQQIIVRYSISFLLVPYDGLLYCNSYMH
jgi:hypothetical protein